MNDSFTSWRNNGKYNVNNENQRASLVISDSEDDNFNVSNALNTQNKFVLESSDDDEYVDSLQSSRSSAGGKENHRLSGRHSTASTHHRSISRDNSLRVSNRIDEVDESNSSMEFPVVRKKQNRRRMIFDDSIADVTCQSENQGEQSLTNYDASDVDDIYESTDDSHDENLNSMPEEGVKDLTSRSEEGVEDLSSESEEIIEDLTSSRLEESIEDLTSSRLEESIEDLTSRPEESFEDLRSRPKETTRLSSNQGRQSLAAFVTSEASNSSSFENTDHSLEENEVPSDEINNTASYSESEENVPIQERREFGSDNKSKEQSEHSLTVSDSTDTEEVSESTDSVQYVDSTARVDASSYPTSMSNSEDHAVVMSLVKKEVGVGNVDPFIAQKRAFLTCNIEKVQSQLTKSKMLLNTANINMLPDKGEKLRRSIDTQEAKLQELSEELKSLPKLGTPKPPKLPKSPQPLRQAQAFHPVMPLSWEDLPETMAVKALGRKALETHEREQALTVDRLEDLHKSLNARPGDDERALDPNGLKVGLMPHQQHALAWLLWREKQKPHGGILADDMGLGKTLTMISLIMATIAAQGVDDESEDSEEESVYNKRTVRPKGGTLVVCPASLLSQWEGEVKKRVRRGMLSVELYHGTNRETVARRLAKNDIVITTYNLIGREYKNESSPLYKVNWKRIILDEAHIIRNNKSLASEAACKFHARFRWALTGTPIQNKELDLYALLKFLKCSPFDDLRVWKRWVDNKNAAGQERLSTVMKTLMLRRTKQELQAKGGLQALPDKNLEEISIKLDPEEQLVYEKVMVYSRTLFAQFLHQRAEKDHMVQLNSGRFDAPTFLQKPKDTQFTKVQNQLLARHADVKAHDILVLLLRLRQVCCHPALIHAMLDQEDLQGNGIDYDADDNFDILTGLGDLKLGDDENVDPNEVGVDKRVVKNLLTAKNPVFDPTRQSSKMRAVLNTIQEILDKGDKMVVVSQWTSMLEVVRTHLKNLNGATYDILSGKVAVKNRQQIVESFNQVGAAPRILLLSLTAGGVGLNLVGGNHLLLLDIHWNPQLEAQAQDRIYRVGQTKSVYIYKFMCLDTVEQRIKMLQDNKLSIAQGVLTGAGTAAASKLSLDDLKSLFSL